MFKRGLGVTRFIGRRYASQDAVVSKELGVEYPKFEPLGNPASMINITLPPSTVLNLRSNSILAANGDLNNINSKLSILKLLTKPLIYNQISSITPLSLLLSNKGTKNYFINLELSKNDTWKILNTQNIVAWYGQDLSISNSRIGISFNSGNESSNIVLNGEDHLFTLNLENDETIYLNPKSIIAINSSNESINNFTKLQSSVLSSLSIPKFKTLDWFKINLKGFNQRVINFYKKYVKVDKQTSASTNSKDVAAKQIPTPTDSKDVAAKPLEFKTPKFLTNSGTWIYNKFNDFFLKDNMFCEIKGPSTIIIQSSTNSTNSQIFTSHQLKEIYKNLQ